MQLTHGDMLASSGPQIGLATAARISWVLKPVSLAPWPLLAPSSGPVRRSKSAYHGMIRQRQMGWEAGPRQRSSADANL
jgi:hypothetical protein